jgi:uncharacterized protein
MMHFSGMISRHRRWLWPFFAWPFVALALSAGPVLAAPSFDCRNASKPDEQAICGSEELSTLERVMAEKFIAARALGDANKTRDFARDLLKQRRGCQADVACIRDVLSRAIALFDSQRFGQTEPKQAEQKQDEPKPAQASKTSPFALELKEETPAQRCDVAKCNADCVVIYGPVSEATKDEPYHKDHGPIGIAMCKEDCDTQRTFCLSHDGTSVEAPDWAPSSMGKMMNLYCRKQPKEQRQASGCEKLIYCSNVATYNTPACQ